MNHFFGTLDQGKIRKNSHKSFLMERAIIKLEGNLGPNGELVIKTGKHTGRSANDKYVVVDGISENKVWWENNVNKMSESQFSLLKTDVMEYLKREDELFYTERSIGSKQDFSLGIDFISTQATAALFTQYMFKQMGEGVHDRYSIYHAPHFLADPKKYGTRSETVIVTCFKSKTLIIVGTLYAGEIKKGMFSVMNFLLPDRNILPMHSGASENSRGDSFLFFGLSGTGKTTLSTDEGMQLIGDDEHGLSDNGIFNFEGGCYAKTYKLSPETEPQIYYASTQFSSFLENVKLSEERNRIDFFDDSLTENGRSSYPLEFIKERAESGRGKIPKTFFYLSADAFGVLPPVSLLEGTQVMDFFKLGYTAKLAGTEVGVKAPTATFSPCFGAPFMLRRLDVYASLLEKFINKYNIKVWMINTGWYGGSYGVGTRFPISVTRNIIRQIQNGQLNNVEFITDKIFHLKIPVTIDHMSSSLLFPHNAWSNQEDYRKCAEKLASNFDEQLRKLK